jgi:hypothetical protein
VTAGTKYAANSTRRRGQGEQRLLSGGPLIYWPSADCPEGQGIEGLVHLHELTSTPVATPQDVVETGDE